MSKNNTVQMFNKIKNIVIGSFTAIFIVVIIISNPTESNNNLEESYDIGKVDYDNKVKQSLTENKKEKAFIDSNPENSFQNYPETEGSEVNVLESNIDIVTMIIESEKLFERSINSTNDDQSISLLKEVDNLCTKILENRRANSQIIKRKMYANIELAKLSLKIDEMNSYYKIASMLAYEALSLDLADSEKSNFQYYYAQCIFELGKNRYGENPSELLKESWIYFEELYEYEPYGVRKYIVAIGRNLHAITKDINYIEMSIFDLDLLDEIGMSSEMYFEILKDLSDSNFIVGQHYYQTNIELSKKYFIDSHDCALKALLIRNNSYLLGQVKIIEEYIGMVKNNDKG